MILSAIPSGIVESIGGIITNNSFIIAVFSIIGGLFMAPVIAYMYSTFAGFYEILSGHLIKETMPVPVTAEEAQQQYEEIHAKETEEKQETQETQEKQEEEENGPESE
jgi:Na+-translocating ferredoxin:NAD+ oxidoreductase RnfG subunit